MKLYNKFNIYSRRSLSSIQNPLQAPVASGTFDILNSTAGTVYDYDASGIFTGGEADSYEWVGTPPPWATLNTSTGVITGTSTPGTWTGYAVIGTNATGSDTTNTDSVTIQATAAAPIASGTFDLSDGTVGSAYTYPTAPLFTGGAPTSYSLNGVLPAGLTLNTSTGVISGTVTTVETATGFSVTGTNASGSDTTNTDSTQITTAPTTFEGYSEIDVTSITIPSIATPEGLKTGTAPFALMASAKNVTCTGTRNLSTKPIIPYEHLEYTWTVTKLNGDPVLYSQQEILHPDTGAIVNPYTDTISPEGTFVLREVGDYTLTLTARGKTATGYISQTFSETISVTKPNVAHAWYDGTNGVDTNDGLDALGLSLTTATYTEATGALTETGAFTAYNHTTATANYPENNSNFIYITKAGFEGLYEIASKTNNDTIVLKDKLGSDQTAVTSATGPKQVFSGSVPDNTFIHLAGGNLYTTSNEIETNRTQSAVIGVVGYGATAPVINTTLTTKMIDFNTNASGTRCKGLLLSFVTLSPGMTCQYPISGTGEATNDGADPMLFLIDRCTRNKGWGDAGEFISPLSKNLNITWWGGLLNSLAAYTANYTLAAGNNSGLGTVTVNEVIDTGLPTDSVLYLWDGVAYDYYTVVSISGSVFTINGTLSKSYTLNGACINNEKVRQGRYTTVNSSGGGASWAASVGEEIRANCESLTLDHYWYPDGDHDNFHVGWLKAIEGNGRANYVLNTNNSGAGTVRDYISYHDCKASKANWFCDFSNATNNDADKQFRNISICRNYGDKLNSGFLYYYAAFSLFAKNNKNVNTSGSGQSMLTDNGHSNTTFESVLEDNLSYGLPINQITDDGSNRELVGNKAWSLLTAGNTITATPDTVAKGNTVWAPNDTDGLHLNIDGAQKSLYDFNTSAGYTNYERKPNWTDAAAGNFAPVESAPTLTGTFAPPRGVPGTPYFYDTSQFFTGVAPTIYMLGGTLPPGLVLDVDTGFITGTPTTLGTSTGISITGDSGYGTPVTTNTASIDIVAGLDLTWTTPDRRAAITEVALAGDFTIKFTYATTKTTACYFLSWQTNYKDNLYIGAGGFNMRLSDSTQFKWDSALISDGTPREVIIERIGTAITLKLDGTPVTEVNGSASSALVTFDTVSDDNGYPGRSIGGVMGGLEFNNAGTITKYDIDSGSITTEEASVGTGTMTFTNVVAGDWA